MISLLFCGDFAPFKDFEQLVIEKGALIFGELQKEINEADISFINLEAPACNVIKPILKSGPVIKINPICLKSLSEVGFDVVGMANNHILDYDEVGLFKTVESCQKYNLNHVGAGKNIVEAQEPIIIDRKGVKIAIIAVAEHEFSIAKKSTAGAAPLDPIDNTYQIKKAQSAADFIFVTIHGGNEYFPYPRPGLRKLCKYFIDQGVDGVVCHHPHVPGAYEYYKDKPIIYSMGNIIFDRINNTAGWSEGYVVRLVFNEKNKKLISFDILPYVQSVENGGVKLLNGEKKGNFIDKINSYKSTLEDKVEYIKEWNKFCLANEKNMLNMYFLPNNQLNMIFSRILPIEKLFLSKDSVSIKLNLVRCESHRELLQSIILKKYREYEN